MDEPGLFDKSRLSKEQAVEILDQIARDLEAEEDTGPLENMIYEKCAPILEKNEYMLTDFKTVHEKNPFAAAIIDGCDVEVGLFIDNEALKEYVGEAEGDKARHIEDTRGSLTLIQQGGIQNLDRVFPRGEIPPDLRRFLDTEKWPITSVYTSLTLPGAIRDVDRLHYHPFQTDRMVFTRGKWEIVFLDLREDSDTYGRLICISIDADQENQVALTIPPGVAHSVANIRGAGEGARLVNFPTIGYGELPEGFTGYSPEVAVRFAEARLKTSRVCTRDGGIFDWWEYIKWRLKL